MGGETCSSWRKNSKWLNDDYVKFIRFAQLKMDAVEEGVVSIISNHSWLDNPTFRAMRQSLMRSFDQIYLLDLHGNSKKSEITADGGKDENVFDIEQGVAISIFVKRQGLEHGIWRGDIRGRRLEKYKSVFENDLKQVCNRKIEPRSPLLIFVDQNTFELDEYEKGFRLTDIFLESSLGSLTKRDALVVAIERQELEKKISKLASIQISDAEIISEFGVRAEDNDKWNLSSARKHVRSNNFTTQCITKISWRPFEDRWIAYDEKLIARTNKRVLGKLLIDNNIAWVSVRQLANVPFFHALVSEKISDQHFISTRTKEGGVVFPVNSQAGENLAPAFRTYLDTRYNHHYSPEEILGYIYAVLHAPAYRSRYAEFLRIDFPRIPFAETNEHFEALSALGWQLVEAHLMRDLPKRGLGNYHGRGGNEVEHVRWSAEDSRISINKAQSFAPVPEAVWNFHIGGYQVIDKYLKSRKGRTLSLDEINHVARICDVLAFTVDQMAEIDAAYAQAFPDRG